MTDPIEALIATVVDAESVFAMPELDENMLLGFVTDVAQAIHPMDVISRRYGFAKPEQMVEFISTNREVRRRIKAKRAVWESDASADERIRHYSQHSVLEVLPQTAKMMTDPTVTAQTRLDALKVHARMAGVDSNGTAAGKDSHGGPSNQFVVNFMFSGGKVQTLSATVVDPTAQADQGPPRLMPALADPGDDA